MLYSGRWPAQPQLYGHISSDWLALDAMHTKVRPWGGAGDIVGYRGHVWVLNVRIPIGPPPLTTLSALSAYGPRL
jgi:hypothetical protein